MDFLFQTDTYNTVLMIAFGYVAIVLVGSFFSKAPYGRFASDKYGINLDSRWGWFLMELPATLSFVFFFFQGKNSMEAVPLFFLGVWLMHYSNRGFIFPMLMRVAKGSQSNFSLMIVLAGWLVTSLHGYLNAVFISQLSDQFTSEWFTDPRFIIGMVIYITGFTLNLHSDNIIRNLRSKKEVNNGEKVYRIPMGGLFTFVSNPSYLTELISFAGFAIATWSIGAVFVLLISAANLIPRAFQVHAWYKEKFPEDYPKERKVLIPFIL